MRQKQLFICFLLLTAAGVPPGVPAQAIRPGYVQEGISGFVYRETGNRMPMKGSAPETPRGFAATICIYRLTGPGQAHRVGMTPFYTQISTRLVATAHSDSTGAFRIRLAPGLYSLFVKMGSSLYANRLDTANHIAPVTVQNGDHHR